MWFCELSAARTGTGFGANPISFSEIEAWAKMTRSKPTPREVLLIRKLDAVSLRFINAKNSSRKQVAATDPRGLEDMFGALNARVSEKLSR